MARLLSLIFGVLFASVPSFAGLVLTLGGDINFNKNLRDPHPEGFVSSSGKIIPWSSYTNNIQHLIDGDLNFANIETVVSSRKDLKPGDKKFVFISHPNSVEELIRVRFNLFNMSNNHTYDAGHEGIKETILNMERLKEKHPHIISFGIGYKKELLQPKIIRMNGYTIAFASLSILNSEFRASDSRPGLINIDNKEDYYEVVKNMKAAQAQYKILSIHRGTEGQVTLDSGQRAYYEYALKNGDVDLIIGHHPHAVRPIEKINGKYIFYSLGNYLMLGAANINGLAGGRDFGLFSRLHLELNPATNKLMPEAIELIPLTDMHTAVRPMPASTAVARLDSFRKLGRDQLGDGALDFQTKSNGLGLYCAEKVSSKRALELCRP